MPPVLSKVTDYQVAVGIEAIRKLVKEKYQPYGEPFYQPDETVNGLTVVQAMVKYESMDLEEATKILKVTMKATTRAMKSSQSDWTEL